MIVTQDRVFRSKVETLLGERGKKDDSAVRFRDLTAEVRRALMSSTATVTLPGNVQDLIDSAVEDALSDYAPPDLSTLRDRIDAAEQEAAQAAVDAGNALSAANGASQYTDQAVQDVRDQLQVDYTNAQAAAQDAMGWADAAEQSYLAAQAGVERLFPPDMRNGARYWQPTYDGDPAEAAPWTIDHSLLFDPVAGDFIRIAAGISATRVIVSRGTAEYVPGRIIRVSVKVRFNGDPTNRLLLTLASLRADFTSAGVSGGAAFAPAAAGQWETITEDIALPAAAADVVSFRAGVRAVATVTPAVEIDVASIRIDDVTALVGAENAASAADIARSDAVSAQGNAETAEAAALSYLGMSAQIASRGIGVINDQFLASEGWARWTGQGVLTLADNEAYPTGRTWDFTVTAAQFDGMWISGSPQSIWPGQTNANGYVIEIEYALVSGSMGGALVILDWNTSTSEFRASMTLESMQSGVGLSSRTRVARGVFKRPDNFSGTFTGHDLLILANHGAGMAAKRIKFHRVNIRPASEEEMGRGEVMAEVQAHLSENYLTAVNTNQAIASAESRVNAAIGGVSATVTRQQTALAGLNGSVARFRDIATVDGGRVAAGIEAVAWDNMGGSTGSLLQLHGDNVIARGTMSTNALVVGIGRNRLVDPSFEDGTAHWSFSSQNGATLGIRAAGQTWAHPGWPTLQVAQINANSGGISVVICQPVNSANRAQAIGVPATPGQAYTVSAYLSTHRCSCQILLAFYSDDGTFIGSGRSGVVNPGPGSVSDPDSWERIWASALAPPNTRYVTISLWKFGTASGTDSHMFIWKPQMEDVAFVGQRPGSWSPGGTTFINGGRLFAESLTAESASLSTLQAWNGSFTNLAAANIRVGNGEIDNAKIGNIIQSNNFVSGEGGQGWRINKAGAAEFNTVTIRRQIEVASGTLNVGYFIPETQWAAKSLPAGQVLTGDGVTLANGPGLVRTVLTTSIPISAWMGASKTYLANAGMTGTVTSDDTDNCYWGWTADVLPLTKWSGNQSLRIRLCFWSQNVNSVSDCVITWKLYEVS